MSEQLYRSPFHRGLWRDAAQRLKDVRMLAICAMFIALHVALGAVFIPVGENLRIYFTFFISALGASVYGPILALLEGLLSDLIGCIVAPSGPFFPGYTLSAMLGSLIYALFFFHQRQSVLRIFLCKLLVNVLVNIVLGSLWSAMLMGKAYLYYMAKSIVKNLLLLPLETAVMTLIFHTMNPLLARMKLAPRQPPLFKKKTE